MKLILKVIIIFCVAVAFSGGVILVKADIAGTVQGSEYLFHLYLNTSNQLVVDRSAQFSYEIISSQFTQPPVGQFPYRGEVIDFTGAVAVNFKFNAQSGALSVYAPYVADGQKVIFYDNQNQSVLTIPVSDSSFCNDDGICNADRGEDSSNCPKDCKQSLPTPLPTTTPTATAAGSSGLWSGILYTILGILLAGLVWWLFKRRRNQGPLPPPSITLPTPPTPPTPNNPV